MNTRLIIGCLFLIGDLFSHWVHGLGIAPFTYFIYMLIDIFTVKIILEIDFTDLSLDLALINVIAIVCHGFGYFCYMSYIDSEFYNKIIYSVAIIQWIRLLWIRNDDKNNFRRTANHSWITRLFILCSGWHFFHKKKM